MFAEATRIPRPPKGREDVPSQLARLLEADEIILRQVHEGTDAADKAGDHGTNDLLVNNVICTNELQVRFIASTLPRRKSFAPTSDNGRMRQSIFRQRLAQPPIDLSGTEPIRHSFHGSNT